MNIFQAWIGYTRTFAVDLNPDAQIHALTAAECGIVYRAQCSGTTQEGRPEFDHPSPVFRPSTYALFVSLISPK